MTLVREGQTIKELIEELLIQIGENPAREGLQKTPERFERAIRFLTSGYTKDVAEVINGAIYEEPYDEMVVLRDIEVFSICDHHLLPFYGKCHVAYLPNGRLIGLSKIPRIVDIFARRLQLQERLTIQIANCLQEALRPKGVGVVVEAFHLCVAMRGVEKQNAFAITSSMVGAFRTDPRTRLEFMNLIRSSGKG